ncbi:hypothetical protein ABZP36_031584 [Zizania latifolia]
MGAGSSILGADGESGETSLGDMPESCVAAVLLHLNPPEICQVASLNRAFRGAASADCVWAGKLPVNYRYLLAFAAATDDECGGGADGNGNRCSPTSSKKDIYARLCRPTPFDFGTKEFWIDKNKGGICLSISSKAMVITGIDDRRYWSQLVTGESSLRRRRRSRPLSRRPRIRPQPRFHHVAYLQQIWWLEVDGELGFCFPAGTYSMFFRLHLGRPYKRMGRCVCGTEHVHGWDAKPTRFQLSTSDEQHATSEYYIDGPGSWILYHVGDFVVSNSDELMKLKFSMLQIDCTHTKGGLCVDSVLIYPKGYLHEKANIVNT